MRLPADGTLIVIGVQEAAGDPRFGPRNNLDAEANIAALIAAWRTQGLPLVHVSQNALSRVSPSAQAGGFKACAAPIDGEPVISATTSDAFAGTDLEALLDDIGATTLVLCGAFTSNSVETTARHAGSLGYQAFVVADACWTVDKTDLRGRLWRAEDVHALSLAHLHGEYATVVETAAALCAAETARTRQRREESRARQTSAGRAGSP
jgi:nicotinamidase-related amidase